MFTLVSFTLLFVLASRAFAVFTITAGNVNMTTSQILAIPDSEVKTTCATDCNTANSTIQACGDDANCLCKADTVASLLQCEQCMFTKLIELNQKMDFRVGSATVLSGYATECNSTAHVTLAANQTALTLPPDWDGPFVAVLPVGGVVVAVGFAAILGFSALFLFSNL